MVGETRIVGEGWWGRMRNCTPQYASCGDICDKHDACDALGEFATGGGRVQDEERGRIDGLGEQGCCTTTCKRCSLNPKMSHSVENNGATKTLIIFTTDGMTFFPGCAPRGGLLKSFVGNEAQMKKREAKFCSICMTEHILWDVWKITHYELF